MLLHPPIRNTSYYSTNFTSIFNDEVKLTINANNGPNTIPDHVSKAKHAIIAILTLMDFVNRPDLGILNPIV